MTTQLLEVFDIGVGSQKTEKFGFHDLKRQLFGRDSGKTIRHVIAHLHPKQRTGGTVTSTTVYTCVYNLF